MAKARGNSVSTVVGHPQGAVHARRLSKLAVSFMDALKLRDTELSLSIVTDRAIRRINRTWRNKDKATDVLSFPAGEMPEGVPGPKLLGDVVISLDTAKRVSREDRRPLQQELARYLAHGLLHLLGHDHHAPGETRRMRRLENRLLGGQGMLESSML